MFTYQKDTKSLFVAECGKKDFCTAQVIELLNEHNQDAKNALIEKELDLIEFC